MAIKLFPQSEKIGPYRVVERVGGSEGAIKGIPCCKGLQLDCIMALTLPTVTSKGPQLHNLNRGNIHIAFHVNVADSLVVSQAEHSNSLVMMGFWQNHFFILVLTLHLLLLNLCIEAWRLLLLRSLRDKMLSVALTLCQVPFSVFSTYEFIIPSSDSTNTINNILTLQMKTLIHKF